MVPLTPVPRLGAKGHPLGSVSPGMRHGERRQANSSHAAQTVPPRYSRSATSRFCLKIVLGRQRDVSLPLTQHKILTESEQQHDKVLFQIFTSPEATGNAKCAICGKFQGRSNSFFVPNVEEAPSHTDASHSSGCSAWPFPELAPARWGHSNWD